jgi:hypothetical protein
VLSSWAKRPWCVGVGVGAVPPRLSSLNMLPFLPLVCVCGSWEGCALGGSPFLLWSGLLDERCDTKTRPASGAGAVRAPASAAAQELAQAGLRGGRGGTGASETSLVGSTTPAGDPHGWFLGLLRAGA